MLVAVPRDLQDTVASGSFDVTAPPEASTQVGDIVVALEPGDARTVTFTWDNHTNFVHLHCPPDGADLPARAQQRRGPVTRTLGNGSVEIELGSGEWTARWLHCGIVLGPCRTEIDSSDREVLQTVGVWRVDTTRTGARARWSRADGREWIELRLPADGDTFEVQAGYQPEHGDWVRAIVPVSGEVTPTLDRQLVNGYDSWSYAGVRADDEATDSYWSTTVTGAAGGLAIQALASERFVTRITRTGDRIAVRSEGSPSHHLVDGSWGHENHASSSDPVRRRRARRSRRSPSRSVPAPTRSSVTEQLAEPHAPPDLVGPAGPRLGVLVLLRHPHQLRPSARERAAAP